MLLCNLIRRRDSTKSRVLSEATSACQRQHTQKSRLPTQGWDFYFLSTSFPLHLSGVGQVKSSGQSRDVAKLDKNGDFLGEKKTVLFSFYLVKTCFMVDSAYIHIIMPWFYLSPWPPFPHICCSPSFPHVVCFCFFDIFLDLVCPFCSIISTSMFYIPHTHTHGGGRRMLGWGREI